MWVVKWGAATAAFILFLCVMIQNALYQSYQRNQRNAGNFETKTQEVKLDCKLIFGRKNGGDSRWNHFREKWFFWTVKYDESQIFIYTRKNKIFWTWCFVTNFINNNLVYVQKFERDLEFVSWIQTPISQ